MRYFIAIIFLISNWLLHAQSLPEKAPADALFRLDTSDFDEPIETGIRLPPIKPAHDAWANISPAASMTFPEIYDMRDSGWLTPVKTQSAGGCWAYSVMGALESRLMMLDYGLYDLSDNNLKYCHNYVPERSTNGNHWMATSYFARRSGPFLESEDPHPGGTSNPGECPDSLTPLYYINQARYPPPDNIHAIKQTVLDYGVVWSLMYYHASYLNSSNHTYYYNGTKSVNHAGCVVGWNDTLTTDGGTGAWIVRNTYGPAWEDGGYYYISYNDTRFLIYNAYWPDINENEEYSVLFQHDEIGGYWGAGGWNETAYGLVKFDAYTQDIVISKVGTFIVYAGTSIEIKIYSAFSDSLSGLLASIDEVQLDLPGYYTFDLDSPVFLPSGQDFYVQVKYNSNNSDLKWPVPIEDTITGYSMPEIETGKYWINSDPETYPDGWFQLGHGTNFHYDLCIKAYANIVTTPIVATGEIVETGVIHAEVANNFIVSEGLANVTSKGICWNLTGNPTISDSFTDHGEGEAAFSSVAEMLEPSTTYFLRAYATNSYGTTYGNQLEFTTFSFQDLFIKDVTIASTQDTCIESEGIIILAGNQSFFVVEESGFLSLVAKEGIIMRPGTHFESGSYVIAIIDTLSMLCNLFEPEEQALIHGNNLNGNMHDPAKSASFRVYPNPTTGNLKVKFNDPENPDEIKFTICNMLGEQLLQHQASNTGYFEIDMSHLPEGLYLLRIITGDAYETVKIMKVR
jgi:hypothetical protein